MPVGKKEVFITFRVERSDYFTRDGTDVHTDANISVCQASLGGTTRVRGIHENFDLEARNALNLIYLKKSCKDVNLIYLTYRFPEVLTLTLESE